MVQFFFSKTLLRHSTDTVSFRLLQRMAAMDMNWNLKKLGQLFQVLMLWLQKSPRLVLPARNLFDIFSRTLQEDFVYG